MESFREWLTNRYAPNTIRDKFIKPLKAVLKYAEERGHSIKPAYKKYSIPYIKVNHPVFYRSEVQKLIGLDLSDRPNLEDYQIVMLFGIFTGARQSLNYANEFDPESSTARPSPPGGCFLISACVQKSYLCGRIKFVIMESVSRTEAIGALRIVEESASGIIETHDEYQNWLKTKEREFRGRIVSPISLNSDNNGLTRCRDVILGRLSLRHV